LTGAQEAPKKHSKLIPSTDEGRVGLLFVVKQRGFDIGEELVYVHAIHEGF
jgi:hypothetical protein